MSNTPRARASDGAPPAEGRRRHALDVPRGQSPVEDCGRCHSPFRFFSADCSSHEVLAMPRGRESDE